MLVIFSAGAASAIDRPKIIVGGDHDNPPYEYLENGKPTGFNVELIQATAEVLGFDVDIRLGPWHKVRRDLEQGKIDALAGMYYSAERRKAVNFSVAHTMVSPALFVRQDSPIRSFEDIRGKEVIVQEGDIIHDFLKKEGLALRIITVTDPPQALRLLASGKHDCAFMPSRLLGEYLIKTLKLAGLRIINTNLPPLRYCFAVTKGNPELRYKLDEGLNILKETGRYREIYEKWFGVYEKKDWWETVKYFALALVLIAAFFAISILWSWSLKRQVRIRTAELRTSEEELRKAHAELEQRVEERTAQLKKANEQLRSSKAEKSLILNSTTDIVVYHYPDMKIRWANQVAAKFTGKNPEELIGQNCWEVWHQRTEPCVGCPVILARDTGLPQKAEVSFPEGLVRYIRAYPIKNDKGELTGLTEFVLDITERKKAEEALRASEEKYRTLVNNVNMGVFRTTIGHPGRLLQANPAMSTLTGYTHEELMQLSIADVYQDPHARKLLMDELMTKGFVKNREVVMLKKDGTPVWASLTLSAQYDEQGNIKWIDGVGDDITERKQIEEALRRAHDELELRVLKRTAELSVTNEKLAVEIDERKAAEEELKRSHEQLRNLAAHLQSVREEERTNIAREIHDELGQVLTALKMDLAWTKKRLPADQQILINKTQSDMALIDATIRSVKRICTELRPAMLDNLGIGAAIEWQAEEFQKRSGIACDVTVDPPDMVVEPALAIALFRIFQEALTNVMRHANATEVKVKLSHEEGRVVLIVKDNGIGIIRKQLSKSNSFGLLGMRERVYPWGGEVEITGIRNKGTAVNVSIPVL